jgi:hypothetical protein
LIDLYQNSFSQQILESAKNLQSQELNNAVNDSLLSEEKSSVPEEKSLKTLGTFLIAIGVIIIIIIVGGGSSGGML